MQARYQGSWDTLGAGIESTWCPWCPRSSSCGALPRNQNLALRTSARHVYEHRHSSTTAASLTTSGLTTPKTVLTIVALHAQCRQMFQKHVRQSFSFTLHNAGATPSPSSCHTKASGVQPMIVASGSTAMYLRVTPLGMSNRLSRPRTLKSSMLLHAQTSG